VQKHKWYNEIVAWASGVEIETKHLETGEWITLVQPYWYEDNEYEYRIKPQPKEPQYLYVYESDISAIFELSKSKTDTENWTYIGKIKLEVDDENH